MDSVIAIIGEGRSGSTLLELLLERSPHIFSLGELTYIWHVGFELNCICSCGKQFLSCPFWNAVFQDSFGGIDKVNTSYIKSIRPRIDKLSANYIFQRFTTSDSEYFDILSTVYNAVSKIVGSKIILDASKNPSHVVALQSIFNKQVSIIHLVRDSRAVVHSWSRTKERFDTIPPSVMDILPKEIAIKRWMVRNILAEGIKRRSKFIDIRYEDLCDNTSVQLQKISNLVGLDMQYSKVGASSSIEISHALWGNPMRVLASQVQIKLDDEWRVKQSKWDNVFVSVATFPLLLKYGYFG